MLKESQNVLSRLASADREHQKEAAGKLLLNSVKFICGFLLAAFALDVVFHFSAPVRLGIVAGLGGALLVLAGVAWYVGWRRRNRLERIARFLETQDPALGSRLINLLQLQDQSRDPQLSPMTRDLARQAVENYALELKGTPLERLARTGELRRSAWGAVAAGGVFLLVLLLFFQVALVEVARFADPFGDHPPYSFTRIQILAPGASGTNVIYGKGFVVRAQTSGHRPKELFLSYHPPKHPEQTRTVPMFPKPGVGFDQLIEPVQTELAVFAHTKDKVSLSKRAHIGVVLTPRFERGFLQVKPPAYTHLEPSEKPYNFSNVQALSGSLLRFRLQSNRPLKSGVLELTGDAGPEAIAMAQSGEQEVSCTITAAYSSRLRFSLTDIDGLPSQDIWESALTVTHDLPPDIRITAPEHDSFVAVDFRLEAQVDAADDYGIQMVRVHVGSNGIYGAPLVFTNAASPRTQHDSFPLDFKNMGYHPGDVVSLYAEAVDSCPDPHLSRSQTVRLHVISIEEYNDFLRSQMDLEEIGAKYDELMQQLEKLIALQKELGDSAEKLKEQIAAAKTPEERSKLSMQLDELLARQSELNQRLNQQAQSMDNFVRKDPVYDVEKDLQEILSELASTIRNSTSSNELTSASIAEQSKAPSGRQVSTGLAAEFKQASDQQVARLEGVQNETEQEIAQTLEDMSLMQELLKDFNEFEALYQMQQELAAQSQAYNRAGALSREDQLALKEMAATEKEVGDRLDALAQKLLDHAEAAEKLFPKAASSGRKLAGQISDLRLAPLARQATGQMLAGKGDRSYRMAERLRSEMEKLFSECQSCQGENCSELDSYLSLNKMKPGKNFAQMAQSRKFGQGKNQGLGFGIGQGVGGTSGYAVNMPMMNLMGREPKPSQGAASTKGESRQGKGTMVGSPVAKTDGDRPDLLENLNPVNRQSGAVSTEAGLDEYTELVDNYFKAITARKKP